MPTAPEQEVCAIKHVALYDKQIAVQIIDRVLALSVPVSRFVRNALDDLRCQLVGGGALSWSMPPGLPQMRGLMCRHLALSRTTDADFESAIALALMHVDGKRGREVRADVREAVVWFVDRLLEKRWSDNQFFAVPVLHQYLTEDLRGVVGAQFYIRLGLQEPEMSGFRLS